MTKKIIELNEKRNTAIDGMQAIRALCDTEKRKRTEAEGESFDTFEDTILELDEQIAEEERMEKLIKATLKDLPTTSPEDKVKRVYNPGKQIREYAGKGVDGLEAEMDQEGRKQFGVHANPAATYIPEFLVPGVTKEQQRTDVLYSNHTTDYDTLVKGLDVNTSIPLFDKLGATIFRGLSAKVPLNFSTGHNSAFIAEAGNAVESSPTRSSATLDPRRIGGYKDFSNEFLAVGKFMPQEFADMAGSVDRALSKEMLAQAVAANIETDHEAADAAAALTYLSAVKLQAGLEIDDFRRIAYVMSAQVLAEAKGIEKVSGSGTFIVDQQIDRNLETSGSIGGYPALGTTDLPIHDTTKYDIIWGDWARAFIGMYDGMEILTDPFTQGLSGTTRFIFSRMADTVVNALGFQSYRNVSVT